MVYARAAYEIALESPELSEDSELWLEYSKVLMHLGEADLGVKAMTTMMRKFQADGNASLYHLTAGAMLSSMGKYEQAGHYFFETIQLGLPKFFTKSDLMFILSRSFEQLGYETKTDASEPVEDGYLMVFSHMLSESGPGSDNDGEGDGDSTVASNEELIYDDWISSFETWRAIGDKCAMHGLFNLAADFYGQGLVRDSTAFLRASLWFRFAKSCFRCARTSDAQLAVKQAVTLDPNNSQCNMALNSWSSYTNNLQEAIDEGPLSDILNLLPEEKSLGVVAALKIQALYRGERARAIFNSKLSEETSIEFFNALKASLDIKIHGINDTTRMFTFSAEIHWKGTVRFLTFVNHDSEVKDRLTLQTPFRIPVTFIKLENTYNLSIENLSENGGEHEIALSFNEKETGIYHKRIFYVKLNDHNTLVLIERSTEVLNNIPKPKPKQKKKPVTKAVEVEVKENVVDELPAETNTEHKVATSDVPANVSDKKEPIVSKDIAAVVVEKEQEQEQEHSEVKASPTPTSSVADPLPTKVVDSTIPVSVADEKNVADDSSFNIRVIEDSSVASDETKPSFIMPLSPDRSESTVSVSVESAQKSESKSQTNFAADDDSASFTHASIVNDSASGSSWTENGDSASVAESIHSLFKPYRSRKGCYNYYGNSFLYNASVVSSVIPSVTATVVPSAVAMNQRTGPRKSKGYLRIDIFSCSSEHKYMFLLPLNLAALDSIHDIVPLLLLVLDEIPTADINTARSASLSKNKSTPKELNLDELIASLTPRRHGLQLFGGKLQLLGEISSGSRGEVVIALNEQSNMVKLQHHHSQSKDAQHNASNVLTIHFKKSDAWMFLQNQVAFAFDCDNGSSTLYDPSVESSTVAGISAQGIGSGVLVDKSMYSKDSFVNDLERSLHNKHLQNVDGDSDDNVSVLTFTDDYEEARKKSAAKEELAKNKQAGSEQQNQQLDATETTPTDQVDGRQTTEEEDPEVVEARLLAEELARIQAENMAKLKAAQLAAQQAAVEEERRRKEEEEANEESRRLEEEAIFAALHPEMGLNTVIDISENDLIPIDVLPDNELDENASVKTYKSYATFDESDESRMSIARADGDNNIQAAFFLAFQVQRLETLEFLKNCGMNAKTKWIRRDAFDYLQKRVKDAKANPVAPRPRGSKVWIKPIPTMIPSYSLEIDVSAGRLSPPQPQSSALSDDGMSAMSHDESRGNGDDERSVKSSKSTSRNSQRSRGSASRFTPKSRAKSPALSAKSPGKSPSSPKSVGPYSFNNKNKSIAQSTATSGSAGGSLTPTPSVEEQREEVWKAQMESKLEFLLDDQLTNEEFTSNPNELVKVLHEFSDTFPDDRNDSFLDTTENGDGSNKSSFNRSKSSGNLMNDSPNNRLPDIHKRSTPKPHSQETSRPSSKSLRRKPSVIVSLNTEKIKDWEEKVAHLTLSNKLNSRGQGNANPVYFLEQYAKLQSEAEARAESNEDNNGNTMSRASTAGGNHIDDFPLETLFNDSILTYHHKGYSTGTCAYLTVWKAKIRQCVRSFPALGTLCKSIVTLRKAYTEQISKAGALCALAHTNGSVGEALGQLLDKNFKEEVLLVCQALPVDEVVIRVEKSARQDKNANEFAVKTVEYDVHTNQKIIKRVDSFPLPEETAYLRDMHSPYPTDIARSSPHFGLTANDESVKIRSAKMPVLVAPKAVKPPTSPDGRKVDTITGFPVIMTSPVPSPIPAQKKGKSKKTKKSTKKTSLTDMGTATESGGRYIRLNDAINMMADETEGFAVVSKLQATRAREEHVMLKYHPQPNSYYRSSKQKQIQAHKQKKKQTIQQKYEDTIEYQVSNETEKLSIEVD